MDTISPSPDEQKLDWTWMVVTGPGLNSLLNVHFKTVLDEYMKWSVSTVLKTIYFTDFIIRLKIDRAQ